MRIAAGAALLAAALGASAQELVTIPTRPGVTQSFFIAGMGGREADAIALLYIGGYGNIDLRSENGQVRFAQGNFLPRARREFIRNGVLPVIMDTPSDARDGVGDEYRTGKAQSVDARAVLAELRKRFPGIPVFIATTSRSTISGAQLGLELGDEIAGVVLSSSMFASPRGRWPVITGVDFGAIKSRILFVHHRGDTCQATPYSVAAQLGQRFPLVTVEGGKPAESGPCDPLSPHGFYGREAPTVDAISAWMLGKPFARNIE
ncbi:MAG TPA: hypothetical protein VEB41_11530 [Burkholderiales bacterium]|nr:hypothetical protein [Burkholderiales bacterium]